MIKNRERACDMNSTLGSVVPLAMFKQAKLSNANMISQQTPTKYQARKTNMPSLQKQILVELDNESLQSTQFIEK